MEDDEFCHVHSEKKEVIEKREETVICQGIKRDKKPCKSPAKSGSLYCREDHNPEFWASPTEVFRKPNLRSSVEPHIRALTGNKDSFTGKPLDEGGLLYHLEHFFEMNLARDIFDHVTKEAKESEANALRLRMRDSFNQIFNLGITEEAANNAKCAAVVEFAKDLKFGEVNPDGLPHYLRKRFTGKSVTRGDVARISDKIVSAYDGIKEFSAENHAGTILFDETMERLDFTFEKMNLQK